jgi:hypothetical protein
MSHFKRMVNHCAKMAQDPGFLDEARHTVKKLEKEHPETYTGLGLAVADQIKLLKLQGKDGGLNERTTDSRCV